MEALRAHLRYHLQSQIEVAVMKQMAELRARAAKASNHTALQKSSSLTQRSSSGALINPPTPGMHWDPMTQRYGTQSGTHGDQLSVQATLDDGVTLNNQGSIEVEIPHGVEVQDKHYEPVGDSIHLGKGALNEGQWDPYGSGTKEHAGKSN